MVREKHKPVSSDRSREDRRVGGFSGGQGGFVRNGLDRGEAKCDGSLAIDDVAEMPRSRPRGDLYIDGIKTIACMAGDTTSRHDTSILQDLEAAPLSYNSFGSDIFVACTPVHRR